MDRIDEVVKVLNSNLLYVGNITDYNAFGIAEKVNRGEQVMLFQKKSNQVQNGISIDDSKRVTIFHLLRNLKSSTDSERGSGSSPRMIEDYELSLYLYYSNQENSVVSKELLEIAKLAFPTTLTKSNKEALKLKTIEFEVTDSMFEKHEIFDSVFNKQKNNLSDNSILVQLNYRVVMEFDRNCIPYLPCDLSMYDIELQRGINNCSDVKDCLGISANGSEIKFLNEQGDFVTVDSIDDIAGLIEEGNNITITGSGTIDDPYVISSSASGGTWGSITGTLSNQTDLQTALNAKQNTLGYTAENVANKGASSGYTPLNSSTKIDLVYLPDAILGQVLYGGIVDASTASATLTNNAKAKLGTGLASITLTNDSAAITGYVANEGIYYITTVSGTFAGISFVVGDWLISIGSEWAKVDNTDAVTSVNGQTGAVTLTKGDIGLGNVDNTSDLNKPVSTAQQTAIDTKQSKIVEVNASITAVIDGNYINTATATYTDPSPVQAKGFIVFIRNGTATIGGTAYTGQMIVYRFYHSGAWSNYEIPFDNVVATISAIWTFSAGIAMSGGRFLLTNTSTASGDGFYRSAANLVKWCINSVDVFEFGTTLRSKVAHYFDATIFSNLAPSAKSVAIINPDTSVSADYVVSTAYMNISAQGLAAIASTTTETELSAVTSLGDRTFLAANNFTNRMVSFGSSGVIGMVVTNTYTFAVRFGPAATAFASRTLVATTGAITAAALTAQGWKMDGIFSIKTHSATATVNCAFELKVNGQAVVVVSTVTSAGIDTTVDNVFTITIDYGTSSASNTCTLHQEYIYKLS